MAELYTTLGASTLNGAITNVAVSLTVTSAASFPTAGNFRIRVDNEIILVTAVAAAVFTIVRGQEGTANVSHVDLSAVTEVMTAAMLDAVRVDVHQTGAIATLPLTGKAGDTFYPSDAPYLLRFSGSVFERWGAVWKLVEPVDAAYAWRNQGTATKSTANGGVYVEAAAAAGTNLKGREIAAPATPYTITGAFLANARSLDFVNCGLYFANAGAGTISRLAIVANSGVNSGWAIQADKLTSATVFSASYASEPFPQGRSGLIWFRIADDGVNRIYSWSADGFNFITFFSVGRTDFLTADLVGFYVESGSATAKAGIFLAHWLAA
jgi:hypothetical protein